MSGADWLATAVDMIASAEGALNRARVHYPDKGECAVRAVIDAELSELRRSRRHILAAHGAEVGGG